MLAAVEAAQAAGAGIVLGDRLQSETRAALQAAVSSCGGMPGLMGRATTFASQRGADPRLMRLAPKLMPLMPSLGALSAAPSEGITPAFLRRGYDGLPVHEFL